LGE
jgi:hypothetical protein